MKPLVNKRYKLHKYPGKGGWIYTVIEEIAPDKRAKFGWVRVKGFIDDYELKNYKLMPLGNGKLFLPVRAEIRKKIKKEEGDWIKVILYLDNDPLDIPDELLQCLHDEPKAHDFFFSLKESEQKMYLDWIYSSKKEETKIRRIADAVNRLAFGLKFQQKENDL